MDKEENKPMSFRPSPELRKKLVASAKINTRSPSGEITHRLLQSFKRETK